MKKNINKSKSDRKKRVLINALVLCVLGVLVIHRMPSQVVLAGDMNANEARLLEVAQQTFEYEGKTYRASSEYVAMARELLMRDDIDLTAEEANQAIAEVYNNVATGVTEGYLYEVKPSSETSDGGASDGGTKGEDEAKEENDQENSSEQTGTGTGTEMDTETKKDTETETGTNTDTQAGNVESNNTKHQNTEQTNEKDSPSNLEQDSQAIGGDGTSNHAGDSTEAPDASEETNAEVAIDAENTDKYSENGDLASQTEHNEAMNDAVNDIVNSAVNDAVNNAKDDTNNVADTKQVDVSLKATMITGGALLLVFVATIIIAYRVGRSSHEKK